MDYHIPALQSTVGRSGRLPFLHHSFGNSLEDRTGQDRTGQDRTGQDRTGQDRTGQDRTGQDRTGQDRTGQDRTGQDRTGQDDSYFLSLFCQQKQTRIPTPLLSLQCTSWDSSFETQHFQKCYCLSLFDHTRLYQLSCIPVIEQVVHAPCNSIYSVTIRNHVKRSEFK
ncbi:hypothetical protein COCON_G00003010 [Conger conger]|uniref:Uncharacterized protein n=1 Tax=Conger conger TaxID=82655 RepID=A0A9Q1E0Z9_CONCO|nr:hypothetical protein COCON_G00003010 [Conger conger]